ncbi:MAG: hypothetical protein V4568_11740 [Pseudomonadota bacterium]
MNLDPRRSTPSSLIFITVITISGFANLALHPAYAQTKEAAPNTLNNCSFDGMPAKIAAPTDASTGNLKIFWNPKTKMLTRMKFPECKRELLGVRTEFDDRKEIEEQDGSKLAYTFTPDEASPNGTLFGVCYNRTISVPRYRCLGKENGEEYVDERKWCWYSPQGELRELKSKYFRDEAYSSPQEVVLASDGEWIGWLEGAALDTRFPKCNELGRKMYLTVQLKLLQPRTGQQKAVALPAALATVVGEGSGRLRILSIDGAAKEITLVFSKFAESDQIYAMSFEGKVIRGPDATGVNTTYGSLKHFKSGWIGRGTPASSKFKSNAKGGVAAWHFTAGKGKYEAGTFERLECGSVFGVFASPTGEYVAIQMKFSGRCLNPTYRKGITHIIRVADNKKILDLDSNQETGPGVTFFNNYIMHESKLIDLAAIK